MCGRFLIYRVSLIMKYGITGLAAVRQNMTVGDRCYIDTEMYISVHYTVPVC